VFKFFCTKPKIGWAERLRNDLFCVRWDVKVKPQLNQLFVQTDIVTMMSHECLEQIW